MIDDSDYEILPHKELEHLRAEVEKIKKNPLGEKYGGHDLIESVKTLTETINHMNDIFTTTNQEMIEDYHNNSMQNNFKMISSQNEQIAKGILSVVDLISKQTEVLDKISSMMDSMQVMHNNKINTGNNSDNNPAPSINVPQPGNFPKPEMNNQMPNVGASKEQNFNPNVGSNNMDMSDPFANQNNMNQNFGMGNGQNNTGQNMNLPEPPPPRRKLFGGN